MASTRSLCSLFLCLAGPLVACEGPSDHEVLGTDEPALTECDATGTWAIKVSTPVKWNTSFVIQGGTGTVTNWLRSARTQSGLEITDTADICGVETPDYQSTALFGSEKYGIAFPDATFGSLPQITLTGTLSSRDIGATFTGPASAALVGATLTNPTTDAWPNVASIASTDSEHDGKPGVTADAKTGPGMSLPPVNATRSARADHVYAAFRQVLASIAGSMTSCTRADATGPIAVLAGKAAIDSHVVGCHRADGPECNASEFKLLDSGAPVYQPTGDAVITMVKIPAGTTVTCADVRALDFAAQL